MYQVAVTAKTVVLPAAATGGPAGIGRIRFLG